MYNQEQIIEILGISSWPEDKRQDAIDSAMHRIGEAIDASLTEQQNNEYQAIIDDDRGIIDAWLEQNVPDYKQSPVYQSFEEGVAEDPEQNSPEKLFASIAWIQFNVPNVKDVISKALADYKQELQTEDAQ